MRKTVSILRVAIVLAVTLTARVAPASSSGACVVGTDPEVALDTARIASLRDQIAVQCVCADYDASSSATGHGAYVRCARTLIRDAVVSGQLRRKCRSAATKLYTTSTCGYPIPADPDRARVPCIEQRLASGTVKCSLRPKRRCVGAPGVTTRAACTGATSCLEAADDNANFLVTIDPTGGDDAECAVGSATVRVVAVGDVGQGNAGQLAVAQAIATKCATDGCDFVQLLGDNIYPSGVTSTDDPQWQSKFEIPYASVSLPFFAVLGNHDYGGNGAGNEFGKGQNEIDYTAVSTKWNLPAAYYRRTWSNVELFGLDTNMQVYGMDAAQRADVAIWLAESAMDSSITWRIALGHHPYLSNGPHGNAGSYDGGSGGAGVQSFMEDLVCGNVDLYLAGHDHSLQWITPTCAGTELAVSGSGASGTTLPGANPTRFQSVGLGFLYVVVDGGTLTAQFVDTSGVTLFSRTLVKP